MSRRLLAWVGVVTALAAMPVGANGTFETYGPSVRARALGNAMVALDDAAVAHTNPAGLGRAPGAPLFHAGFSLDVPIVDVKLDEARDADDPLFPANPAPVAGVGLGFTIPLDLVFEDRFFVGFTGYFPTKVFVRARAHDPQRPFFYAYDSATDHYDLSVALGAKVVDWLYFGVGARLTAGQAGDIRLAVDPIRGRLTEQSVDTFQFPRAAPTAGVLVGPLGIPHVVTGSWGFVWREPSTFEVALPARLEIEGADVSALLDILVEANFSPRSFTSGTSVELFDTLTVSLEAQYAMWSEAPSPFLLTSVDLGGDGLAALGLDDALDAPADGQERVRSPGLVDTITLRAGAEGKVLRDVLVLRAGYQLRPSPVPDQTSGTNIVDCTAHVLTAGFALTFPVPAVARPVTVDAAYQAQLLAPRTATKTDARDEIGDWTASGVVHALAVGWTYRF